MFVLAGIGVAGIGGISKELAELYTKMVARGASAPEIADVAKTQGYEVHVT